MLTGSRCAARATVRQPFYLHGFHQHALCMQDVTSRCSYMMHAPLQALTTGLLDFLQNEAILLTHFSQRYSAQKVVELLDAALPPELRQRCTPLLAGFR